MASSGTIKIGYEVDLLDVAGEGGLLGNEVESNGWIDVGTIQQHFEISLESALSLHCHQKTQM